MNASQANPTAALLIIGNEILSGDTQDANIQFLAVELKKLGIRLLEIRVVADIVSEIVLAVNELRKKYGHVFTTGGIGSTHDDVTAEAMATAFNQKLLPHPDAVKILKAYYKPDQLNEARLRMALTPQGASLIENPVSSAPGFRVENVYVMAGVPGIMQAMFKTLQGGLSGGAPILSKIISCNLFEGDIADDLAAIQKLYERVEIGSYPNFRNAAYSLRLVVRATDAAMLNQAADAIKAMIARHGGEAMEI